jgi:hypothetical protein
VVTGALLIAGGVISALGIRNLRADRAPAADGQVTKAL